MTTFNTITNLRKKRRPIFISTEEVLIRYLQRNPNKKPDGSFVEGEWLAGFEAGRKFEKKRTVKVK